MPSRWFRLDTTWAKSEWLFELPSASRLAWIMLLGYTKSDGAAGAVKRLSFKRAAHDWNIPPSAVSKMISAAIDDGALVVDLDEWVLTGWKSRQGDPTAAERMKSYRQRQKALSEAKERPDRYGSDEGVTPVTDVTTTLTFDVDVDDDDDSKEKPPSEAKRKRAIALPDEWKPNDKHVEIALAEGCDIDRSVEMFRDHALAKGRTQLDWDRAFNNWLRNTYDDGGRTNSRGRGEKKSPAEVALDIQAAIKSQKRLPL